MDKAVMMSIKPEWCVRIAIGEKTVEVRKMRPKIEPPFKCFIYCSNPSKHLLYRSAADEEYRLTKNDGRAVLLRKNGHTIFNGYVFGEFVCDKVLDIFVEIPDELQKSYPFPLTGMTDREIMDYLGNGKPGYGWHISGLVIYAEPKSLDEFYYPEEKYCEKQLCGGCPYDQVPNVYGEYAFDCEWKRPLKRSPQSWCYVQEVTK